MKNRTLAIEFATNLFGGLKQETKNKLQKLIDNPCQKTWDNAYSIILNQKGMKTLWQAVLEIDPRMPRSKNSDSKWGYIPSREIIIKAINNSVFKIMDEKVLN